MLRQRHGPHGGDTSLRSEVEVPEVPVGGEGMFGPESAVRKDKIWAELDADGESKVRERLAMSYYGDVGERRALVVEWLQAKVKNDAPDVRAAAAAERAASAAEQYARAAARRTRAAKRAKRRATIGLIFVTLSAAGLVVLVILSLAE